jgi:cyclic pyranopterin phosphate synthase
MKAPGAATPRSRTRAARSTHTIRKERRGRAGEDAGRPAKGEGRMAPERPEERRALVDGFGRVHRSLRLSVTDRCNLRCSYCIPSPGVVFLPREEILTYEEFEVLVLAGIRLGIQEVRVTGGEPLVRRDVHRLVSGLAGIEGIRDLSLTTNGYRLREMSIDLKSAGLRRVTVSLDTLRRDRFRALSGVDALDRILEGIGAAREAGLSRVKINTVLMRGVNDDEILDLAGWARDLGVTLRFIEIMPVGAGPVRERGNLVPGREVASRIDRVFPLVQASGGNPGSTARVFRYADGRGEVGFINPVTEPFCTTCDRVRITADGKILNCLFDHQELDLRGPLRAGAPVEELETIWRGAIRNKGPGGCAELHSGAEVSGGRSMWQIGG